MDREARNAYHADYHRRRYAERMELASKLLGGRCVRCGKNSKLHIDHIDPETKVMELSNMTRLSMERFLGELEKCQLLCTTHHMRKHHSGEITHGTQSGYTHWKCRCDECRGAVREAKRRRRVAQG